MDIFAYNSSMGWQRMTMCSWDSAERGGPLPGTRAAEALKSYLDSGRKLRGCSVLATCAEESAVAYMEMADGGHDD